MMLQQVNYSFSNLTIYGWTWNRPGNAHLTVDCCCWLIQTRHVIRKLNNQIFELKSWPSTPASQNQTYLERRTLKFAKKVIQLEDSRGNWTVVSACEAGKLLWKNSLSWFSSLTCAILSRSRFSLSLFTLYNLSPRSLPLCVSFGLKSIEWKFFHSQSAMARESRWRCSLVFAKVFFN